MKKEKQLDQDLLPAVSEGVPAKTTRSNADWQDDDTSVGSTEENWCIVSDNELPPQEEAPKGNSWWEKDDEEEPEESSFVEKLTQFELYQKLPPNLQNPKNLLLLLHLLVGLFIVIHLAWDRYSWRSSAMHLEQELRILKTTEPSHASSPKVEIKEPPPFHIPDNEYTMDPNGFNEWEKQNENPDNVILDNCWVHARASVSFRECAEDAKDTLQEVTTEVVKTAKTFAKHTWKAAKRFTKHVTAAAEAEAARRRNQPY